MSSGAKFRCYEYSKRTMKKCSYYKETVTVGSYSKMSFHCPFPQRKTFLKYYIFLQNRILSHRSFRRKRV